jgi:hypothetical protein
METAAQLVDRLLESPWLVPAGEVAPGVVDVEIFRGYDGKLIGTMRPVADDLAAAPISFHA